MRPIGFRAWLETLAAAEAVVPARVVLERLPDQEAQEKEPAPVPRGPAPEEPSWRVRLWTVPSETRLGVAEAAEALGRPKSFIYGKTAAKAIPFRKLDGVVLFTAGELRAWIRDHEVEVVGGPMEAPALKAS